MRDEDLPFAIRAKPHYRRAKLRRFRFRTVICSAEHSHVAQNLVSMRRIPSLDGLRAISITLVLLGHLVKWKHVSLTFAGAYGALGVHIFFVLSGFLITKLLLREHDRTETISLRDFYIRRAYRIFPAAMVYLLVVAIFYWQQLRWYDLVAATLYVANMHITRPWMMGHLWSLSIEEQFYLLWPLALKTWFRHRTAMLLGVMVFTPVFMTALYAVHARGGIMGSLPVYADELAIGCLLAIFASRIPRIPWYVALVMACAMFLIPLYPANTPVRTLFLLFVLKPLMHVSIAGVVLHVIQVPYRFLNWAPVAWLGKISYSLYLWQEVFCSNPSLKLGYTLALLAIAAACLSYYCVEQPMLRLREKRTRKNTETPTLVTEATSSAA
jgi:peptidoglycan/LPS O-acetylase OafA/YrhL